MNKFLAVFFAVMLSLSASAQHCTIIIFNGTQNPLSGIGLYTAGQGFQSLTGQTLPPGVTYTQTNYTGSYLGLSCTVVASYLGTSAYNSFRGLNSYQYFTLQPSGVYYFYEIVSGVYGPGLTGGFGPSAANLNVFGTVQYLNSLTNAFGTFGVDYNGLLTFNSMTNVVDSFGIDGFGFVHQTATGALWNGDNNTWDNGAFQDDSGNLIALGITVSKGLTNTGAAGIYNSGPLTNTGNIYCTGTQTNTGAFMALSVTTSNTFFPLIGSGLAPNMNYAYSTNYESGNFAFLAPVNVNTACFNSSVMLITNTAGGFITATPAAGWQTTGSFTITNVSAFTITIVPGWMTNVVCVNLY